MSFYSVILYGDSFPHFEYKKSTEEAKYRIYRTLVRYMYVKLQLFGPPGMRYAKFCNKFISSDAQAHIPIS